MKISNKTKLEIYKTKCKDLTTVNGYIQYYQQFTRSTVENILKLSCLINEMKEKENSGELNESDVKFFCLSVGLNRKGSTFRKFEQIGKHSETFWKYVDKLPDSYTVLYEITTLDSDRFEELMSNNQITSYVTLKDIKMLSGKVPTVNNSVKNHSSLVTTNQMKKLIKSINRFTITVSRDIPKNEFDSFIEYLNNLQKKELVQFEIPQTTGYIDDETEDITDEKIVTL